MGRDKRALVLIVPFILFTVSVWLFVQSENWVGVQFSRAKSYWRDGRYTEAVDLLLEIAQDYPRSQYADDALWEVGEIYYVNLRDIPHALIHLEKLAEDYPSSSWLPEVWRRLAEIHDVELHDLETSAEYLGKALADADSKEERSLLFRLAGVHLRMDHFDAAFAAFEQVAQDRDDELAEQSLIRMGTILQIRRDHAASLPYFQRVLQSSGCQECRVRAQLGLIESYEFLENLSKALEVARTIDPGHYPPIQKEELIRQLEQKQQLFGRAGEIEFLWDGR